MIAVVTVVVIVVVTRVMTGVMIVAATVVVTTGDIGTKLDHDLRSLMKQRKLMIPVLLTGLRYQVNLAAVERVEAKSIVIETARGIGTVTVTETETETETERGIGIAVMNVNVNVNEIGTEKKIGTEIETGNVLAATDQHLLRKNLTMNDITAPLGEAVRRRKRSAIGNTQYLNHNRETGLHHLQHLQDHPAPLQQLRLNLRSRAAPKLAPLVPHQLPHQRICHLHLHNLKQLNLFFSLQKDLPQSARMTVSVSVTPRTRADDPHNRTPDPLSQQLPLHLPHPQRPRLTPTPLSAKPAIANACSKSSSAAHLSRAGNPHLQPPRLCFLQAQQRRSE